MKQQVVANKVVIGMILLLTGFLSLRAEENQSAVPNDSIPYAEGILLFFDSQYDQAAAEFAKAEQASPDNPVYSYFLGLCSYRKGNFSQAEEYFRAGAEKEWTNRGRLIDIGSHLRRIQGEERMTIEKIRQEAQKQWEEKEAARQKALYGETLDRQKAYLRGLRVTVAGPSQKSEGENTVSVNPDTLPSVPPIAPLEREEQPGQISPELLASWDSGLVVLLQDEYIDEDGEKKLRTSLSTRTQKRKEAQAKRLLNKDPDTRPAADGSEFIDIYDAKNVVNDDQPFFDPNEPEEPEETVANQGPSQPTRSLFSSIGTLVQQYGKAVTSDGSDSDIKAETTELFGDAEVANPFAGQSSDAAATGPFDPFKADRAFQPK